MQQITVDISLGDAILQLPQTLVVQSLLASIGELPAANSKSIPELGEYWPGQGGYNAGLMRNESGQNYYLIVCQNTSEEKFKWGENTDDEQEAKSKTDGHNNTKTLMESSHTYPAAEHCKSLSADGHNDFYLPAQRELSLCWANVPELFTEEWYWSSTQCSRYGAWMQDFSNGGQDCSNKSIRARARAVRRLFI